MLLYGPPATAAAGGADWIEEGPCDDECDGEELLFTRGMPRVW